MSDMEIVSAAIEDYALQNTREESQLLTEIREATDRELEYSNMLTNRLVGRLLQIIIKLGNVRRVLELGTFTGYSALTMAEALPEEGEIRTLEMNEKYERIAHRYINRSLHADKVEIVMGEALETLPQVNGPLDMAFIDADKKNYPKYYKMVKSKLVSGGIIVVDNAFWDGTVLDPEEDEKGKAVHRMNRMICEDEEVEQVLLTVRDGLHLVRKR
jgi:caffeoyl-CoA O-methyltransferase